jgi:integrase
VSQKAVMWALRREPLTTPKSHPTWHHSFATHLREDVDGIGIVPEHLGHRDVAPYLIHTHVLNRGRGVIISRADRSTRG